MRLTLAVVVTTQREEGRTLYECRTLRGTIVAAKDSVLSAALAKLAGKARRELAEWIQQGKVRRCTEWLADSSMKGTLQRVMLTLRDRTLRIKVFVVSIPIGDRLIAFCTSVPELVFEVDQFHNLEARTTEVLTEWCSRQLKEGRDISADDLTTEGDVWLESVEVDVEPPKNKPKESKNLLAALLGHGPVSGAEELHKVGHCLDYMVSDFEPAIGRREIVEEIDHVLSRRDRQGVLIVGAAASGKTTVFHECVKRRFERFENRRGSKPQTWWISPQRLVSGMMYLGQWEQRWLAILREAAKRDHILYFEDLIGLYTAGITRDSRLCAADVLKSFLSEHRVRIVGETTPEELAVLRRRDRALADRFHLVQVPSLSAVDCLPVLLEAADRFAIRKNVFFHPGVAPLVIRQQEVLSPNRAFPGKAIELLKTAGEAMRTVTPHGLLEHLHRQTGTSIGLLYRNLGEQSEVEYHLGGRVIGQAEALKAMSRVVVRFTQQLQPADKPVGVLLFLGPTGVGKTESAKALTELLFSDATHMIRIDMNEITTPAAAEQLVGTFDAPEGRLTSAVRRRPHSVILLDEIEKAHPDVFDYLLQVLGEGRLTDARGRIVDFRSSIIIMTSNLGATAQNTTVGFETDANAGLSYTRAAEKFFRPEFFNRIDEVIAFHPLSFDDIKKIVLIQLRQLPARDGLKRRHVFVHVEPAALDRVAAVGFDKHLGARAVRRALEREIVQPLGDRLSELSPETPVLIRIADEAGKLKCSTLPMAEQPIGDPAPLPPLEELVSRAKTIIDRLESELTQAASQLKSGVSSTANADRSAIDDNKVAYYTLHEQIFHCSSLMKAARYQLAHAGRTPLGPMQGSPSAVKRTSTSAGSMRGMSTRRMMREWLADEEIRESIASDDHDAALADLSPEALGEQLVSSLVTADALLKHLREPRRWLFGVESLSRPDFGPIDPASSRVKGILRHHGVIHYHLEPEEFLLESLVDCLASHWQYETATPEGIRNYRLVSGIGVSAFLLSITGAYVVRSRGNARDLCCLRAIPVPADSTYEPRNEKQWIEILRSRPILGPDGFTENEQSMSVIRGEIGDDIVDYISGSRLRLAGYKRNGELPGLADWARWWVHTLPLPPELSEPVAMHSSASNSG
ncbi:MAG: AAA family ATPase [Pirellulales bacterium]